MKPGELAHRLARIGEAAPGKLVATACRAEILEQQHERAAIVAHLGRQRARRADRQLARQFAIEAHFLGIEPVGHRGLAAGGVLGGKLARQRFRTRAGPIVGQREPRAVAHLPRADRLPFHRGDRAVAEHVGGAKRFGQPSRADLRGTRWEPVAGDDRLSPRPYYPEPYGPRWLGATGKGETTT